MRPEIAPGRHMKNRTSTMKASQASNLSPYRNPTSVWERRGWDGSAEQQAWARMLLAIGGSGLALQGLQLRSWKGWMLTAFGWSLACWALTSATGGTSPTPQPWLADDPVHVASAESFPASDAPAWTLTVGTSPGKKSAAR
jgi:hypothetical protein